MLLQSEKYLTEGKELLDKGDLVQAQPFKKALTENASLKFWGASALAVKRIAAMKGLKLEKHENELDKEAVEITAENIEKLIDKLRRIT